MTANTSARCAHQVHEKGFGPAPADFTPELSAVWNEFLNLAPRDVMVRANREVIEAACRLMLKLRAGTLRARDGAVLLGCLDRLHMTPAARRAE